MRALELVSASLLLCCASIIAAEGLDPATLKKVKDATVYLRVISEGKELQGSGFCCDGNLIVTNAHVLGLKDSAQPPSQIALVFNSGIPEREFKMAGQLAAFDSDYDLAFIKADFDGKQAPEPLKLSVNKDLAETTPVFIFGYPFGAKLAGMQGNPAVTVGTASISSLRLDRAGLLDTIQINGDLNPGNSGGPIVLNSGEVAAVSVSTVLSTQIGFAIPSDKVRRDISGRVRTVNISKVRHTGMEYEFDVHAALVDPLNHIKSATFYAWTAEPGSDRTREAVAKLSRYGAPGDGERLKFELKSADGSFASSIKHVMIPDGKEFWFEVGCNGDGGKETLLEARRGDIASRTVDAQLTDAQLQLVLAKPSEGVMMRGSLEHAPDGSSFIEVKSKPVELDLPKGLIQLACPPSGKVVYGIFRGNAGIKIFEPPKFTEIDEIPIPTNAVGIWCDEKRIVVACDQTKAVAFLDAETHTLIKLVSLKDAPQLTPIRVVGPAPEAGFMVLWQNLNAPPGNAPSSETFLYFVKESGETRLVTKGYIDWCTPICGNTQLFAQGRFSDSPSGIPEFIDMVTGQSINVIAPARQYTLFDQSQSGLHRNFGHCFQTFDRRNVVLPTPKISVGPSYYDNPWTYIATDDLSRFVCDFPGTAIAEVPKENIFVTRGNIYHGKDPRDMKRYVFYVNRLSGQVIRRVEISDWEERQQLGVFDCATPSELYVPGHELLLGMYEDHREVIEVNAYTRKLIHYNKAFAIRCGPVENAPAAVGIAITNNPPVKAHVGKEFVFTPTFTKVACNKVVFSLRHPLEGMAIDPDTGTLKWTPTDAQLGKYDVRITADVDGHEMSVFTWILNIQP
jgi:hypothetical protein